MVTGSCCSFGALCGSGVMSFSGYWYVNVVSTCLLGGSKESSMTPSPGTEVEAANGDGGIDIGS